MGWASSTSSITHFDGPLLLFSKSSTSTQDSPGMQKKYQYIYLIVNLFPFRANEVHLRLGLIYKMKNDFDTSLKHFTLAKNDSSPCSFTPLEIR